MRFQDRLHWRAEVMLIEQATNGNLEAFNQLALNYQEVVYNLAHAVLGDSASAEDAVQESFIKAFQSMKGFRGGSFRGWLLKIVTNSAYDMLRRYHRHPTQPLFPNDENDEENASWLADPGPTVQSTVEQNELSRDLHRALEELPDVYRSVLTLVDLYELDYRDAAEALKIPIGTAKSRLARARHQISEKLRNTEKTPLCLYCPA